MTSNQKNIKQAENLISIQDLVNLCLVKWRWFLISFLVIFGITILYILTTPPVYNRSASILIKEDTKGQSIAGDMASIFSDFGLSPGKANVNNELIAIQSPAVVLEVVKRLRLDVDYQTDGKSHKETLYGSNLPIRVSFVDIKDNESVKFTMKLLKDSTFELYDFKHTGESVSYETIKGRLHDTITTPIGKIIVVPTMNYYEKDTEVYVSRTNLYNATEKCISDLTVSLVNEKATVINLSYKDVLTQRAEDVLNMMISVYNENWIKDKNRITISTSMFINERLKVIEQELGAVDEDISSYKSKNLLPNVETASNMYMTQSHETNNLILELNTRLSIAKYIQNYLQNSTEKDKLLPANSGIESSSIEEQISEYNTMQLQRNNLAANSSEQNPLVADIDQSLKSMREAILSSIDNFIITLNTQIENLQLNEEKIIAQIAANPNQAKHLLSIGRQQQIKEALYLFLLQKREENELSQAFTAYNTRLLNSPTGSLRPIAPRKINILLVAFVLSLITPVIIIFIRENINTTIRGRKDLENLTLPFIGEIPLLQSSKRNLRLWKKSPEMKTIVVKEGKRDVINEAFRVLRTNLEFMMGKEEKSNVVILTSLNPSSGKTFLTLNIAISLAIKGKKVLVIDGDLRRASTSAYVGSPALGVSDFLGKRIDSPDSIIVTDEKYINLSILPVGTLPPNPTELLFEERLEQLINDMRNKYDYIFIDCPPIDIVADTQIIEKLADRTIFVVRAGLLERNMLSELENIYTEKRFKNMSLILNGTTNSNGRYGYKYGYRYGYSYGLPSETE